MDNFNNLIYKFLSNPLFCYSFYCFLFSFFKDKKYIFHTESDELAFQNFNKGFRWSALCGFLYLILWFIKYIL